jgi:UDP-glucose 4-epimerase
MSLYVVTGGAGFIGSHLVERLVAAGHAVRVVDDLSTGTRANLPRGIDLLEGDVADPALMARAVRGAAGIYHLAAIASVARANEDWMGTHRTNQSGTIAVLEAARDAGRRPVVFASSAAVYGDHGPIRLHEGLPPRPLSAYGADKLGSELHARVAAVVHATPSIGLRFFNVFGPRQDPRSPYSGVISIFAERVLNRRLITINGDGMQTRDFINVADVVGHMTRAMERMEGRGTAEAEVYNVCTGFSTSILGLAETLGELAGWVPEVAFAPARPGDIRSSLGNPTAARAALGVDPPLNLAEGLDGLLASLRPGVPVAV